MTGQIPRVIALLGREPGLAVLQGALLENPRLELVAVYTHGLLPKAEGGGQRPDLDAYRLLCQRVNIPLHVLDGSQARQLAAHLPDAPLDVLVSLSWRYLVDVAALKRFRLGAINLHRGALPEYAGAEPVRRALESCESRIAITAHKMAPEIDAGEEISRVFVDIDPLTQQQDSSDYAELIKARIVPLYSQLCLLALSSLMLSDNAGTSTPSRP